MEYNNNYYPVQSGHLPPNQQHGGGPQLQHQHQPPPPQQSGQMIQSPMSQQNTRPAMPPGPPNHHQHMQQMQSQQQQQQHIAHHPQQQHPNYQQIQPPHPHGPASHSGSPHAQQSHHHNHNHQPNMPGQMQTQQQAMPQHVHTQSPHQHHHHHHGGQPMHPQQQQQPQQQHQPLNQMVRPPIGPPVVNQHPHPGPQQSPGHNHMQHQPQQNFYSGGGGPVPQPNLHHYPPNQHHHPHQSQQHHAPPVMHHAPFPPMQPHQHPHLQPPGVGRNSPYYPNILQTEFRIIELNRRLQCRPAPRHPYNPLPGPYDESIWWERFAADFFEDDATLTLRLHDDKQVEYTIGRTLIPRFFRSYFDGGVTDLSITLRNPKETCINPHMITLDCDQAFIVTNNIFRHPSIVTNQGVVVHTEGHLTLDFVSNSFDNLYIKSWRFYTKGNKEFIDRSILNTMGLPSNYLVEPITRLGFTKSTITYLKMCMVMEPMQELMFQHKQTKLDPRSCLRKLLYDRYQFRSSFAKSGEDNRTATSKRKRKKPPAAAAPAIPCNTSGAPAPNKRSKAGVVNNVMVNNVGGMNNMIMSPSGAPSSFSLASQDVMVVGEPSMMGGDFGDDNERMITRLENTQYDPTASTPSNGEESDILNAIVGTDIMNARDDTDAAAMENHVISPSMMQQVSQMNPQSQHQQSQHHPLHPNQVPQHPSPHQQQQPTNIIHHSPQGVRVDQSANPIVDLHSQHQDGEQQPQKQPLPSHLQSEPPLTDTSMGAEDVIQNDLELNNLGQQENLIEKNHDLGQHEQESTHQSKAKQDLFEQNGQVAQAVDRPVDQSQSLDTVNSAQDLGDSKALNDEEGTQVNPSDSVANMIPKADTIMKHNISSTEQPEDQSDSVQTMNDESNSNSQLPCSTANPTTAMEQQQPVNNGVA